MRMTANWNACGSRHEIFCVILPTRMPCTRRAMTRDRDTFHNTVAAATVDLRAAQTGDAVEICRQLEKRLRAARNKEAELQGLKDQLKPQAEGRERAKDKLRRSRAALDVLCAQAGCTNVGELPEIERKSMEKHDAVSARENIEMRVRED